MASRVKDWLKPSPVNAPPVKIKGVQDVTVSYRGKQYKAVFGPSYGVEQDDGNLWFSGKPSIDLADPKTGDLLVGLTVEVPEAALGPHEVLVCGRRAGLMALVDAGVVRWTGERIRSKYGTVAVCELLMQLPYGRPLHVSDGVEKVEKQKDRGREM